MSRVHGIAALLVAGAAISASSSAIAANTWEAGIVETLTSAIQNDPNDATSMLRLAAVLRDMGRIGEATAWENRAKALGPEARDFSVQLDGGCTPNTGPDIIVGDLISIGNYTSSGQVAGMLAFSIGTTSCNIGSQNVNWISNSTDHPVIAQNFYRIKDGRIEQIGLSWLKHGFTALTQNLCCTCNGAGGSVLGVGCSDPYSSSLNGSQTNLGPRWEVNASTGAFPWPSPQRSWTPPGTNALTKRVQVHPDDLDPALNSGAIYIAEGHYISPHDAAFAGQTQPLGNGLNNASYRRFSVSWNSAGRYATSLPFSASTVREKPAILAWQDFDPTVTIVNVDIVGDGGLTGGKVGRFIIGYKVTNNGNGTWTYEYAVFNLNSHSSASSFRIPVGAATLTNIGFKDVAYHSGDGDGSPASSSFYNYDGTDWVPTNSGGSLTWNMVPATPLNNSNALRWSTLYNFRFTANQPPQPVTATLGLFRTGGTASAQLMGPACILEGDFNNDNVVNFTDLNIVLSGYGGQYGFTHLNQVLSNFGATCN